jgi:hypothetical protein
VKSCDMRFCVVPEGGRLVFRNSRGGGCKPAEGLRQGRRKDGDGSDDLLTRKDPEGGREAAGVPVIRNGTSHM